jgi:hypothetical protein
MRPDEREDRPRAGDAFEFVRLALFDSAKRSAVGINA